MPSGGVKNPARFQQYTRSARKNGSRIWEKGNFADPAAKRRDDFNCIVALHIEPGLYTHVDPIDVTCLRIHDDAIGDDGLAVSSDWIYRVNAVSAQFGDEQSGRSG